MLYILPVIILSLSIYRIVIYYRKSKNYYKTDAVVVGSNVRTEEDALMGNKYYYSAIVEFTDKQGSLQKMVFAEENPERPLYANGSKIKLLVNPDDPTKFLEYDFITGYLIPIIWIIIGLSIVVVPALFPESFK
jgi:hypothetical protein